MGKRGSKPKERVLIKWTTEFAYAIGLLTTDGSLSKDGRHINFTSKDEDQVKTFKDCLKLDNIKIGKKSSGIVKEKIYSQVQFGDVVFYQWLVNIGLSPNKSKTMGELKIPDAYFLDFLRGCFDGDGSIYSYWDPRWRSSYMFYVSFASASPKFLLWLQKKIVILVHVNGNIQKLQKESRVGQLRFAKKEAVILCRDMYHSKNIPYLKRKFAKMQKIFTIDQENKNAQVVKVVNTLS